MSDYSRSKVIRLRATEKELGVEDVFDMEDKYKELFTNTRDGKPYFEIAPTETNFIDYVLFNSYGEECSEFGRTRELTDSELEKYIPIFKQIYPNVSGDDLRYVDYCFYNCSEAPDYFDDGDEFYDEI